MESKYGQIGSVNQEEERYRSHRRAAHGNDDLEPLINCAICMMHERCIGLAKGNREMYGEDIGLRISESLTATSAIEEQGLSRIIERRANWMAAKELEEFLGQHREVFDLCGMWQITTSRAIEYLAIRRAGNSSDLPTLLPMQQDPLIQAILKLTCPHCSHELKYHLDKYGCEIERGDGYPPGTSGETHVEQALGPCGCNCEGEEEFEPLLKALREKLS